MPDKNSATLQNLLAAQQKKLIVRFSRSSEAGTFTGFVLGIGPKFFLLASLGEGLEFERYVCLRIKDIRRLESPAKNKTFYKAARKALGYKMPRGIKLDLADIASILKSASPSVVTIHLEKAQPDCCYIGYSLTDNGKDLEMLEIRPDGTWESKPGYFKLKQITRIDLPGPYERALIAVGGYPDFLSRKRLERA